MTGTFGRFDVAVNNVGDVAREQMSWRDITEESIDHVLAVDIKGTLLCTHEFGSRMLESGGDATLGRSDWKAGRGDQLRAMTPMGRIPQPAELAGAALFLASEDAAHMTGGFMVADGGYNMVGA